MIDILTSILDGITAVFGLIINIFTSLINLFLHLPTYTDFIITSIGFLPSIIMPFAIASISIYVVFLLINRGQ